MLNFAPTLSVPVDAALGRFVLLGKSGSGKSNGNVVLAEEFIGAGVPTWQIDPLGNLYGERSSGDGQSVGLPIVIFGGAHADAPIGDGGQICKIVAGERISAILDLTEMGWDEQRKFAEDFLDELLVIARKTDLVGHVILDEADRFAPNTIGRNPVKSFARTARNMSLGWTFCTQRPQILSPEVIESASAIIAMKINGDLAQDSIGKKVTGLVGKLQSKEIITTLPTLKKGEAWLLPDSDWLHHAGEEDDALPVRFRFRWRNTFDSTAPRRIGVAAKEMKVLAPVDLTRIRKALTIVPKPARDDVAALKTRVAELEALLDKAPDWAEPRVVPILTGEHMHQLQLVIDGLSASGAAIDSAVEAFGPVRDTLDMFLGNSLDFNPLEHRAEPARSEPTSRVVTASRPAGGSNEPGSLSGGRQKMLNVLAGNRNGQLTRAELGFMSGYAHGGGTFQKYLSDLKTVGHVEVLGQKICITPAGAQLATPLKRTTRDVVSHWLVAQKGGRRKMLATLVEVYPKAISRAELGDRAGYESSGGTFQKYLSDLKGADLITVTSDGVRAADELFPTGVSR